MPKKTITIKDFVTAVRFRIGEGAEHLWECFGPEASILDWVKDDNSASGGIVYDSKTHVVYEATAWDTRSEQVWRWNNPAFKKAYRRESKARGHDPDIAYDRVKFQDVPPSELMSRLSALVRRRSRRCPSRRR